MFANLRQQPYRVAIEGFSEFEREVLASCFRLGERRVPAYAQVDSIAACDFLVVDADRAESLARVARDRRARDAVYIGAAPPSDALAWLLRPIDPLHVMRALDTLLGARLLDAKPRAAAVADPAPAASATAAPPMPPSTPKRRPNRAASGAPRGGDGRPVLVVDDSRVARTFLAQRLAALGYRVSVAASAEEALELSAARPFAIVFLDLKLGEHDASGGLELCRSIKQRPPGAAAPPAVVITTASTGASDRVRGSLAGCDAYLTKPLLAPEFTDALRQVDPLFAEPAV